MTKAYPTPGSSGYTEGTVVATMYYDGLGRRIVKDITNTSYQDYEYHYYYDGQSVIQTDNGLDQMLKQYVWGLQYIDELCQIGVNQDPNNADYAHASGSTENECEYYYYALQDANYNVLAVVNTGLWGTRIVERYEYTPYGQRTVYSHGVIPGDVNGDGFVGVDDQNIVLGLLYTDPGGPHPADIDGDGYIGFSTDFNYILSNWNKGYAYLLGNDSMVTHPYPKSTRFTSNGEAGMGPALCEVGHQGLFHDEEFGSQGGLIHNRARTLHPRLARFMQRDPLGYVDGMSLYAYIANNPIGTLDPRGMSLISSPGPNSPNPFPPSDTNPGVTDHLVPGYQQYRHAVRKNLSCPADCCGDTGESGSVEVFVTADITPAPDGGLQASNIIFEFVENSTASCEMDFGMGRGTIYYGSGVISNSHLASENGEFKLILGQGEGETDSGVKLIVIYGPVRYFQYNFVMEYAVNCRADLENFDGYGEHGEAGFLPVIGGWNGGDPWGFNGIDILPEDPPDFGPYPTINQY